MKPAAEEPVFFATPAELRRWFSKNHARAAELLVGFRKKGSGRPSITWPESVDEALCVGWIDGVRRNLDADSYTIRFTPRKPTSIWSAVNIRKMAELIEAGRVEPAGLLAFEKRSRKKSAIYAYEQGDTARLDAADESRFRADEAAWTFFQAQAPWYRRKATWWVVSAKKDATRQRRLETLIARSAEGRQV